MFNSGLHMCKTNKINLHIFQPQRTFFVCLLHIVLALTTVCYKLLQILISHLLGDAHYLRTRAVTLTANLEQVRAFLMATPSYQLY